MTVTSEEQPAPPAPRPRPWLLRVTLSLMLGVGAAAAVWFLYPVPRPTVRTVLRVPVRSQFLFKTAEPVPDLATHQNNQAAMIKSRLVLNSALRDPAVSKLQLVATQVEPVDWLEKEVMVDFDKAPEIMRISMSGENTDELVVVVNAIRQAYLREVVDRDRGVRRERLAMLGEFREKYEGQLRAQRDAQREIEQKIGASNANVRARMHTLVQKELGMSESEMLKTRFQLRQSKLDLAVLQEREKRFDELKISEAEVTDAINRSPEVQKYQAEIRRLKRAISEQIKRSARGEKDLAVFGYRNQLRKVEKALEEERQRLRPEIIRHMCERARADMSAKMSTLRDRITALESLAAILEPEVMRLQARAVELNKHGIKLDAAKEDMSHLEEMTKRISSEESALKVELEVPSRVMVLEEATVSRADGANQQRTRLGLSGLAGLGCALLVFACLSLRVRLSLR